MKGWKSVFCMVVSVFAFPGFTEPQQQAADFEPWCEAALKEGGDEARTLRAVSERLAVSGCHKLGEALLNQKYLWLNGLDLKAVGFLKFFPSLARLDLTDNRIQDLTPLKDLSGLTHLWLGENEITDVSALSGLRQLRLLVLENNRIADPSPLSCCLSLQALDLGRNRISDVGFMSSLTEIRYIYVNHNFIEDIAPIAWSGDLMSSLLTDPDHGPGASSAILSSVQINWDALLYAAFSPSESFRVFHLEGNPVLREFWEGGYVKKKSGNCPTGSRFPEIQNLCNGLNNTGFTFLH